MIEHLSKSDALKFLCDLENCTHSKIMVSTLYGYFRQGVIRDNKYEEHLSRWLPDDFEKHGLKTFKTGMGYDLEYFAPKLRIFNLLQLITRILRKTYGYDWGGIVIFAIKQPT